MIRKSLLGLGMLIIPMSMIANDPGKNPGGDPKQDSNTHETEVSTDVPVRAALMLSADDDAVTVRWKTNADQDNSLYSVQRTSDGESWQPVFSLRCNNKATQGREHAIYDRNLQPGDYTYRVRAINLEGDVSYSESAEISVGHSFANPVSPMVPASSEALGASR